MRFILFRFTALLMISSATSFADSIPEQRIDSIPEANLLPDSSYTTTDTSVLSDSITQVLPALSSEQSAGLPMNPEIPMPDSNKPSIGLFLGFGAGVTLGNLPLLPLWKSSLPDSLTDLGLQKNSFVITADTSLPDSLQIADTSMLVFRIKEHPSQYNMTFPLRLSLFKINERSIFRTSLTYSLIYKNQKSIVFAADDTLNRRIDLKQKLFLHSAALEINYGLKIPSQYFSIESIEKSYLFVGLGISPVLYLKNTRDIDNRSEELRMQQVENSIRESGGNLSALGTTFTFKTGISAIRRLSSNGIAEISLCYTLNWFDYFYNEGNRIQKSNISGNIEDKGALSFLSNRFEISVSIYRQVTKKQKN
jgi:hypothetical protein